MKSIGEQQIQNHIDALAKIGNLGPAIENGFLRASWSKEESEAMSYIAKQGENAGLVSEYDIVGNLIISTPGKQKETVQIGSHLDTVPNGGLFDGGVGIIAGLEAILALKDSWQSIDKKLQLIIWRGEEGGTFGAGCKGSRAAVGPSEPSILNNLFESKTLKEAIEEQGFSADAIENNQPCWSQETVDNIAAHLEIHIEQGKLLEEQKLDIGIVTSIRAPFRTRITVKGEAAHSGSTPMGSKHRRDANLAMSHMHVKMDQLAQKAMQEGNDLVQTVGVINSDKTLNQQLGEIYNNAITIISKLAYFTIDIRSNNKTFRDAYVGDVLAAVREIANEFNVEIQSETIQDSVPIESLDVNIQEKVEASCKELGITSIRIPSGAMHDVGILAKRKKSDGSEIPCSLLFIPCRDGVSHNPKEFSSTEAITKGANALAQTISKLAS